MESEAIRSFIAIELPDEIKNELSTLVNNLKKPEYSFVKWVNPQGIHLTLKFLGNVNKEKVPEIVEIIQRATDNINKFSLQIANLGVFPNFRRPRVFWIGINNNIPKLTLLQNKIDQGLETLGLLKEKRPFSPHITLARINDSAPGNISAFGEFIRNLKYNKKFDTDVKYICLMQSQLFRSGAIYTKLAKINLS